MPEKIRKWLPVYCLLAGGGDAVTGLLLIASPAFTLRLMGIAEVPAEPVFLSWVGVFVAAVGFAYLYPFALPASGRWPRLRVILEVTALERFAVALFVAVAVAQKALGAPWLSVFATDLVLATAQTAVLVVLARSETR